MQNELKFSEQERTEIAELKRKAADSWMCSSLPYEIFRKYHGYMPANDAILDAFKDIDPSQYPGFNDIDAAK